MIPQANLGSMPVIPQILGKEPAEFVDLANRLYDIGYNEINWNIGCPMRKITAKHRGSGILPYPDEVKAILDTIIPQLRPSLSVKMRLGLYNADEIFKLIPILNDYPLDNITIHPRTGRQQYSGQVDLNTFEEVLPLIHHKVIFNGDICTLGDYHRIHQRFPDIEDFMIGRGVLFDPLLPLKIKSDSTNVDDSSAPMKFILTLLDAINQLPIPEVSKMRKTKEYWCLQRCSLPITEQQSLTVLHAQTPEDTRTELLKILHNL